jgi:hypothetical protein
VTVVHIAGAPTETQQRCVRCHKVLIDLTNAMVPEGSGPISGWAPGGYVGVVAGNPEHSFTLPRDASAIDEISCHLVGVLA